MSPERLMFCVLRPQLQCCLKTEGPLGGRAWVLEGHWEHIFIRPMVCPAATCSSWLSVAMNEHLVQKQLREGRMLSFLHM